MIDYQLNNESSFAQKLIDGIATGEWANTQTNQAYLKWLAEGNTPEPADEVTNGS